MDLDLRAARAQVSFVAAVLHAAAVVPIPIAGARNAEAGMHHDDDELAARLHRAAASLPDRRQRSDVLDRQDAYRRVERGGLDDLIEPARVADTVLDRQPIGAIAALGRLDQRGGGVDADDGHARGRERAAQPALAAGHVEDALPGLRLEQPQRARDDDLTLILAAALADELVVPAGDVLPAARDR